MNKKHNSKIYQKKDEVLGKGRKERLKEALPLGISKQAKQGIDLDSEKFKDYVFEVARNYKLPDSMKKKRELSLFRGTNKLPLFREERWVEDKFGNKEEIVVLGLVEKEKGVYEIENYKKFRRSLVRSEKSLDNLLKRVSKGLKDRNLF